MNAKGSTKRVAPQSSRFERVRHGASKSGKRRFTCSKRRDDAGRNGEACTPHALDLT